MDDESANVYAPPTAEARLAIRENWTVIGALREAVTVVLRAPWLSFVGLGVIPTLSSLPLDFVEPVTPLENTGHLVLYMMIWSLIGPGQFRIALALARRHSATLRDYITSLGLAPQFFVAGAMPWLLLGSSFLVLPETSEPSNSTVLLTALVASSALVLILLFSVATYALADGAALGEALSQSTRRVAASWFKYLRLSFATTAPCVLVGVQFDLDGPSLVGTMLTIPLAIVSALAWAVAYTRLQSSLGEER